MAKMKLKSIFPENWYRKMVKPYEIHIAQSKGVSIYSQEGEELIIEKLVGVKKDGFYIDIGAHHPYRFSNTCYFYKQGWSGINIEPNPELFNSFLKHRKRDYNLNIGISSHSRPMPYYWFEEPAYNTFSTERLQYLEKINQKLIRTGQISTLTLDQAIQGISIPDVIDFINIDTEGMELEIVQSMNWTRIRPSLLVLESKVESLQNVLNSELTLFLKTKAYVPVARLYNIVIYKAE